MSLHPPGTLPRLSTRSRLRLRRLAVSRIRARHASRLNQAAWTDLYQRLERVELARLRAEHAERVGLVRLRADRADRLFHWLVSTSPASAPTSPASAPTSPALQPTELPRSIFALGGG